MGTSTDPCTSNLNCSRSSGKRRPHRRHKRQKSVPCGHCCGNETDRSYYSTPMHSASRKRKRYGLQCNRNAVRSGIYSPKSSPSSDYSKEFLSSKRKLDIEKPCKSSSSLLPSESNSSKMHRDNNETTRVSMESREHGLEHTKHEQFSYEDAQKNDDFLNLSLKLIGTPKPTVEGITQDDFKLNFLHFRCDDDSSQDTGIAREEAMHGLKARKKRLIPKTSFQATRESHSKMETATNLGTSQPQQWDEGIICDLCRKGPSLLLGEWYCGHCGSRIANCHCRASEERVNMNVSSRVHKMCALWSFNTHVDEVGAIRGLSTAITKGKSLKCVRCQRYGATLECSMNMCDQSFHYSCADLLASRLQCTMWIEEKRFRLYCYQHHSLGQLSQADKMSTMKNQLKRAFVEFQPHRGQQSPRRITYTAQLVFTKSGPSDAKPSDVLIEVSSDTEKEDDKKNINEKQMDDKYILLNQMGNSLHTDPMELRNSGSSCRRTLYFIGVNLLSEDISNGCEPVPIPCTNDIDSAPAPSFKYIAKSKYLPNVNKFYKELFLSSKNISQACKGCSYLDLDDPHKEPSLHVSLKDLPRHSDARFDWQGQPMFGRLPYDQYGRLQVGHEVDIVECNSRCPCGIDCLNKELQKGLRFHLEVYRTKSQFWAVRTMEAIARGKFVVEYAGEILTHENAHKLRGESDSAQLSCFSGSNHQLLMSDGYRMSNVARFIRSSFQGNLEIHRVYTETVDPRFYRIGLYAARDIDIGEELSFRIHVHPTCGLMSVCFPSVLRKSDELNCCDDNLRYWKKQDKFRVD